MLPESFVGLNLAIYCACLGLYAALSGSFYAITKHAKIGSIYYRQQSCHVEYNCSTSSTEVKHLCAMIALGNQSAGSVGLDVNDAKRYRTCVTSEPSHCCIVPLYNSGRAPFSGDLWGQEDMVTYPQWTEHIDFIQKRWNILENLLALSTSSDKPTLNIQKIM